MQGCILDWLATEHRRLASDCIYYNDPSFPPVDQTTLYRVLLTRKSFWCVYVNECARYSVFRTLEICRKSHFTAHRASNTLHNFVGGYVFSLHYTVLQGSSDETEFLNRGNTFKDRQKMRDSPSVILPNQISCSRTPKNNQLWSIYSGRY